MSVAVKSSNIPCIHTHWNFSAPTRLITTSASIRGIVFVPLVRKTLKHSSKFLLTLSLIGSPPLRSSGAFNNTHGVRAHRVRDEERQEHGEIEGSGFELHGRDFAFNDESLYLQSTALIYSSGIPFRYDETLSSLCATTVSHDG